jgi:hypothetical protein
MCFFGRAAATAGAVVAGAGDRRRGDGVAPVAADAGDTDDECRGERPLLLSGAELSAGESAGEDTGAGERDGGDRAAPAREREAEPELETERRPRSERQSCERSRERSS